MLKYWHVNKRKGTDNTKTKKGQKGNDPQQETTHNT
jgi:hypothetical protein